MSKQASLAMFRVKRAAADAGVTSPLKRRTGSAAVDSLPSPTPENTADTASPSATPVTANSSAVSLPATTTATPAAPPAPASPSTASYSDLTSLVPDAWRTALADVIKSPAWSALSKNLAARAATGERIFPPPAQVFAALAACPPEGVRVVIIGQDPYHDNGQAEGLSFSVPKTVKKLPPSLKNIYKVLQSNLGASSFPIPAHGHLGSWAQQGVLLLNTALTVKAHEADSHKKVGWEPVTDAIVATLAAQRKGLVWLCWGNHAQKKAGKVSRSDHLVLETSHPSPLGASRGFLTCKHFVECNEYLKNQGKEPIEWRIE